MAYENKAGHVISDADYKELKPELKGRYVKSDKKITPKMGAKVSKPKEVEKK